jgi:hypothetical protein
MQTALLRLVEVNCRLQPSPSHNFAAANLRLHDSLPEMAQRSASAAGRGNAPKGRKRNQVRHKNQVDLPEASRTVRCMPLLGGL